MPIEEIEGRLTEIPPDRPVVAYCRGPFCVFASEAVETLQRHGFAAERMTSGIPEWRLAGRDVTTGDRWFKAQKGNDP